MKYTLLKFILIVALFVSNAASAQTGSYTQTKPNMSSVYSTTAATFTSTPLSSTNGTLSCNWLGCQDPGMSNPTLYFYIYVNGTYQTLTSVSQASYCSLIPFSYTIPMSTLNAAIQAGGGSVMLHFYISDPCPAGAGCSFYNDPLVYNLTLSYGYSQATFSATSTSLCPGQSTTFTNTTPGATLTTKWYFNGGSPSTSTASSPTVTYASPGTYPVALVTTSASGTDSTITNSFITVNAPPTPTVTPQGATTFCTGSNVILKANTGSGLTYQWQKNNNNISAATAVNYTATGTGNYRVIETNSFGCSAASAAVTVTSNPKPTAILTSGLNTTVCPGDSVVLTANAGSGYTYTWKKNYLLIAGATSANYSAKATGNYFAVVANAFGCTKASNIIPVTVNTPKATVTAQGALTVCNGNGVTLKANTGAGLTYQWKVNNVDINGATDSMYTAYTSGSYKVKVTNSCGSTSSAAKVVTINPLPAVSITANGATSFCTGGSVTLTAAGDTGLTYQWRKNNVNISGATSASYNASTTGSYNVIATNSFGCTSSSNAISVTANTTTANVTANGPTSFCNGDSVKLSANTGASLTYQWTKNNVNIAGATLADYMAKTAGAYRVNITNTATGCPKTSAAVQVVVNCRLSDIENGNGLMLTATPNPFTGATEIDLTIPGEDAATLEIYTVEGKLISQQLVEVDTHTLMIGKELLPGTYIVSLKSGNETKNLRLIKY